MSVMSSDGMSAERIILDAYAFAVFDRQQLPRHFAAAVILHLAGLPTSSITELSPPTLSNLVFLMAGFPSIAKRGRTDGVPSEALRSVLVPIIQNVLRSSHAAPSLLPLTTGVLRRHGWSCPEVEQALAAQAKDLVASIRIGQNPLKPSRLWSEVFSGLEGETATSEFIIDSLHAFERSSIRERSTSDLTSRVIKSRSWMALILNDAANYFTNASEICAMTVATRTSPSHVYRCIAACRSRDTTTAPLSWYPAVTLLWCAGVAGLGSPGSWKHADPVAQHVIRNCVARVNESLAHLESPTIFASFVSALEKLSDFRNVREVALTPKETSTLVTVLGTEDSRRTVTIVEKVWKLIAVHSRLQHFRNVDQSFADTVPPLNTTMLAKLHAAMPTHGNRVVQNENDEFLGRTCASGKFEMLLMEMVQHLLEKVSKEVAVPGLSSSDAAVLRQLGPLTLHHQIAVGTSTFTTDASFVNEKIVIEIDGPSHFKRLSSAELLDALHAIEQAKPQLMSQFPSHEVLPSIGDGKPSTGDESRNSRGDVKKFRILSLEKLKGGVLAVAAFHGLGLTAAKPVHLFWHKRMRYRHFVKDALLESDDWSVVHATMPDLISQYSGIDEALSAPLWKLASPDGHGLDTGAATSRDEATRAMWNAHFKCAVRVLKQVVAAASRQNERRAASAGSHLPAAPPSKEGKPVGADGTVRDLQR